MVFASRGWRLTWPAAACLAAAGMVSAQAMDRGGLPVAAAPGGGKLMWGGPVPKAPIPGKPSLYVPSPSAYAPAQPSYQPSFEPEPALDAAPESPEPRSVSVDGASETASIAPSLDDVPDSERAVEPEFEPEPEEGGVKLYRPNVLAPDGSVVEGGPIDSKEASLAPLGDPVEIPGEGPAEDPWAGLQDPWQGLKEPTPGAVPPPPPQVPESRVSRPERLQRLERRARPSFSELQRMAPPRRAGRPADLPGRGALEENAPSGYQPMPASEVMCRRQLAKLGVRFVDATSIRPSRSCGIQHPVKITEISPGIAMKPTATLNCAAALRVAEWMRDDVKPAARWKLLKRPTALINASSYRCSRIAGSRSVSEHASGNALDVAGFRFADGSIMSIEKKGFFDFREKAFQTAVRTSACEFFGTVLGPGYNRAHADHLHLDAKPRRRTVCK